jgi:hypothetical protein
MCCGPTVVTPWETEFEKTSNAGPGWQSSLQLQHAKFKLVSQNPGESVHAYNVRWNLEGDLVDELAVADMYPAGSVHAEELESMYIRILAGSFSSRLLDL